MFFGIWCRKEILCLVVGFGLDLDLWDRDTWGSFDLGGFWSVRKPAIFETFKDFTGSDSRLIIYRLKTKGHNSCEHLCQFPWTRYWRTGPNIPVPAVLCRPDSRYKLMSRQHRRFILLSAQKHTVSSHPFLSNCRSQFLFVPSGEKYCRGRLYLNMNLVAHVLMTAAVKHLNHNINWEMVQETPMKHQYPTRVVWMS